MKKMTLMVLLGTAFAIQGCTHVVLSDSGPKSLAPAPRYPLRASLQFSSNDRTNSLVREILTGSNYFSAVDAGPNANTDVVIMFNGTSCGGRREHLTDSFLGTWYATFMAMAVGIPTLGSIPITNSGSWDCSRNFTYRLTRSPNRQELVVQHPYRHTEYNTTFSHFLLTSKAREDYQLESSVDHAVANLLNNISSAVSAQEQK